MFASREEMAEIAKEVGTIGGIATVSVLHSFIPTHWLPFSIVGRAQNWSIHRILLVSKSPFPNPPENPQICKLARVFADLQLDRHALFLLLPYPARRM